MPTASASTNASSSHRNQVGAPLVSVEVGCTDGEVVADGAAVDAVSVGDGVSVRSGDWVGSGSCVVSVGVVLCASTGDLVGFGRGVVWIGDGAATGADDSVGSGAVSVGEVSCPRSGDRVGSDVDGVCSPSGVRVRFGRVAVGDGSELGVRVGAADGRSPEPLSVQELRSRTARTRTTARAIGSETTDPAPLFTLRPFRGLTGLIRVLLAGVVARGAGVAFDLGGVGLELLRLRLLRAPHRLLDLGTHVRYSDDH